MQMKYIKTMQYIYIATLKQTELSCTACVLSSRSFRMWTKLMPPTETQVINTYPHI